MTKVLFYIHSLNKGGAERVLLTIADEIVKSDEYKAVILTDTVDETEYELSDNLRRIVIDKDGHMSALSRLKAIRHHVKREAPDKIVVFMLSSVIRAVLALTCTGYRVIGAVRSNPYDDYSKGKKRALLLWACGRCERIVCQTEYQKEFFGERLRDKCIVISNPIFREFADKATALGIRDNEILSKEDNSMDTGERTRDASYEKIVATGRLYDYKNHRLLIDAFARIASTYPDAYVVIYGEGPYREQLQARISELALEERVLLPGDSDHVAADIEDAMIYVLPSDTEGLPNALMEAMALGLPVIATDCPCGGPKSLIEDGVNGILTPVGDVRAMEEALIRLMSDAKLRADMGRRARDIIKTNSVELITDKWKQIL